MNNEEEKEMQEDLQPHRAEEEDCDKANLVFFHSNPLVTKDTQNNVI